MDEVGINFKRIILPCMMRGGGYGLLIEDGNMQGLDRLNKHLLISNGNFFLTQPPEKKKREFELKMAVGKLAKDLIQPRVVGGGGGMS